MVMLFTTIASLLGLMICITSFSSPKPVYLKTEEFKENQREKSIQFARSEEEMEQRLELEKNAGVLGSLPHREIAERYEASVGDIYGSVSRMFGI